MSEETWCLLRGLTELSEETWDLLRVLGELTIAVAWFAAIVAVVLWAAH